MSERYGRADLEEVYHFCRSLESMNSINARDLGSEIDTALHTIELAMKKAPRPEATNGAALDDYSQDQGFWRFVSGMRELVKKEGEDSITDEHVLEAFLQQRRMRKAFRALL